MNKQEDFDKRHYWSFSDDRATGHKSVFHWIHHFIMHFDGIYNPVSANVTAYTQVADDSMCNGQFKRICRTKGRHWMRTQIIAAMNNTSEKKKVIVKVGKQELDQILGETVAELNSESGIKQIQKAFHHKLDPKRYDVHLKNQLKRWEEIKHRSQEELFPDKRNYWINIRKKDDEYKGIDEDLLIYKSPKLGYKCDCGWTYSSKYAKQRIQAHNKICAVHSDYGIVPALQPKDYKSNPDSLITEFIGYKKRLDNNKCMFNLNGRCISYTDRSGDHSGVIISDMGKGIVMVKDEGGISHCFRLKDLKYHNTVKIWRNY